MPRITCPVCGSKINDNAESCISCGLSVEWIKRMRLDKPLSKRHIRCIVCGTDYELSDCRCPKCGYPAIYLSPELDLQESIDACRKNLEVQETTEHTIADDAGIDVEEAMLLEDDPNEHPQKPSQEPASQKSKASINKLKLYQKKQSAIKSGRFGGRKSLIAVILIIALVLTGGSIAWKKMRDKAKNEYQMRAEEAEINDEKKTDVFTSFGYYNVSSGKVVSDDDYFCSFVISYQYDEDISEYYIERCCLLVMALDADAKSDSTKFKQVKEPIIKKYDLVYDNNTAYESDELWINENNSAILDIDGSFLTFYFYYNSQNNKANQVDLFGMEITEDNVDQLIDKIHALGFTDYRRADF